MSFGVLTLPYVVHCFITAIDHAAVQVRRLLRSQPPLVYLCASVGRVHSPSEDLDQELPPCHNMPVIFGCELSRIRSFGRWYHLDDWKADTNSPAEWVVVPSTCPYTRRWNGRRYLGYAVPRASLLEASEIDNHQVRGVCSER